MERTPGRRLGMWAVALLALGGTLALGVTVATAVLVEDGYTSRSVPSVSMDPTYRRGDTAYFTLGGGSGIRRGDIALISAPTWVPKGDVLKRVVALGGDRISYKAGDPTLVLNGVPLEEPYLKDRATPATASFDVIVPEGRMFVLGDNRGNSNDSRMRLSDHDGTLPVSAVRGKAVAAPAGFRAAGAAGLVGIALILAGGGVGAAALVVRGRARRKGRLQQVGQVQAVAR
ncbi:signal peptidase I [Streptomyces sp. NBC_01205]|uniref:signal peptidase I n=1 Tax=Streptomyces sp. NBC_01205 TaxID=2903771 RepID=UPI002E14B903|nr:signal peptidase I [Streptomyces sp. NBC_01205]